MGRITVFGTSDCPHCARAEIALASRNIPFVKIDIAANPHRRCDMLSLSNKFSVPQVFFNDQHIGGADDLIEVLESKWDGVPTPTTTPPASMALTVEEGSSQPFHTAHEDSSEFINDLNTSPLQKYKQWIASEPDPTDPRLRRPTSKEKRLSAGTASHCFRTEEEEECIKLPNSEDYVSVLEVMLKLDRILDSADRRYNAHTYKNCFINTDAVTAIQEHFNCKSREQAVKFGRKLQHKHGILHHVCGDHEFRDDGYYFFRLQCYHQPDVLNSYCLWKDPVNSVDCAGSILMRLKNLLNKVLANNTEDNGLIDYIAARYDSEYPAFEEAVCELQAVDMGKMEEPTRLAFALNLYNLMIQYAFVKMGIGCTSMARNAFFSKVKMNIGGLLYSFNDLENGIIRANTRHPYAMSVPFAKDDPRLHLSLSKLDCRIHFALNCGAKSCPPVKVFRPCSIEEELRVVSLSFCELDDTIRIDEAKHELSLSMLFKWFASDFSSSKDKLPTKLLDFLHGPRKEALQRMLDRAEKEKKAVSVKYLSYDWNAPNASRFEPYKASNLKRNAYTPAKSALSCFTNSPTGGCTKESVSKHVIVST